MRILITGGKVLTGTGRDLQLIDADLLIEGERITEIAPAPGKSADGADRVIDASGRLVIPGLVNGHLHTYDSFLRGWYEPGPLETWILYSNPSLTRPRDPREMYIRTLLSCIEHIRTGTTSVQDDLVLKPLNEEGIDASVQAYMDAGLRSLAGIVSVDRKSSETYPYLPQLLPADVRAVMDQPVPSVNRLLELNEYAIKRWHGHDGRVHVVVAPSAVMRCTDPCLEALQGLAQQYDLPLQIHALETKVQAVTGRVLYGQTLIEHLAAIGLLSPRLAIVHAVWTTPADVRLMAETGVSVVHSPVCNLKLQNGVAPVRAMLDAGITLALGCDNVCANDSHNMFDAMKFAALLPQAAGPVGGRPQPAYDAWTMATIGGARAYRLDRELGSIEVGKRADLVLVNLNSPSFTPLNDAVRQLVYCESGAGVEAVIVNGRIVMEAGRILTFDEAAVYEEAREWAVAFRRDYAEAAALADRIRPHMEQVITRCLSEEVGCLAYGPW